MQPYVNELVGIKKVNEVMENNNMKEIKNYLIQSIDLVKKKKDYSCHNLTSSL